MMSSDECRDALGQVESMEVVRADRTVALRTLALPGIVARLQAVEAEHVEALGQNGVLSVNLAAWTGELFLVFAYLL